MDRNALPFLLSPLWTCFLPPTSRVVLVTAVDDDAAVSGLTWQSRTGYDAIAAGRHHPITFANETHGFLLTGSTADATATSDFLMYDEVADEWIDLTDTSSSFPGEPRSFGYGVVLNEPGNTKAYVGFGASDGELLTDLWEFDMSSHIWTELAEFPGPGRRHPAMNAVLVDGGWRIHVGLGDGVVNGRFSNMNDWWSYDVDSDGWKRLPDFPSSRRHHPFHFALGGVGGGSYAGLGHSDGLDPYIERDWYRFDSSDLSASGGGGGDDGAWVREGDFASYDFDPFSGGSLVTTEARVAGTQFAVDFSAYSSSGGGIGDDDATNLTGALGFVLSGDGDDHGPMETGEFHAFYTPSAPYSSSSSSSSSWWRRLPPHPGRSRWAPGSFVIRGTARAYFTSGYDRTSGTSYADLWTIDLSPLFLPPTNATIMTGMIGGDRPTTEEERSPNDEEDEEGKGGSDTATVATSSEAGSSLGSSGSAAWGSRSVARNYPAMGAAAALLLSFFTLNH